MESVTANVNDKENRIIIAKSNGEEMGYLDKNIDLDMEIGEENDFKFDVSIKNYSKDMYAYKNRIFIPGTEYGGIIDDIEVNTGKGIVTVKGITWRRFLHLKIVEPPDEDSHLMLDGELNEVIRMLIGERLGTLFVVPQKSTEVRISNWRVDRYVTLYDAIMKFLDLKGYRLRLEYVQPELLECGYVEIQAVPVVDYSEEIEYSEDGKVHYMIRDYRGGINHLICAGSGQDEERMILHLFVQEDGSIGKRQFYFGLDEREEVYEFTNADAAKLEEGGEKRLKKLKNYKKMEVSVNDMELELGDIVGGYEEYTGTQISKPVVRKILKVKNGNTEIEYKIKGDD